MAAAIFSYGEGNVKKSNFDFLALLLAAATLLAGCGSNNTKAPKENGGFTITDSTGREIKLAAPVTRAVIANAYNAELINAIGAMDKVVGVDYYIYQDQEGFKHRFTKDMMVGQSKGGDMNYEKIIELKPQA